MLDLIAAIVSGISFIVLNVSGQSFPPPLGAEEERELFRRLRAGGAQAEEGARTKLIEHNLRLVAHIVRKYYSAQGCSDDLISIGSIGLIKAIDSFNPEKGARFATYSAKCIQNEILMYFRSQKKNAYEVSINETIDTDRDGNPLTAYIYRYNTGRGYNSRRHRHQNKDRPRDGIHTHQSRPTRKADNIDEVRTRKERSDNAARGRRKARNKQIVHIENRKKCARKDKRISEITLLPAIYGL